MKRLLLTSALLCLLTLQKTVAQQQQAKIKNDTIPGLILYKEHQKVTGSTVTFKKETKDLEMSSDKSTASAKMNGDTAAVKPIGAKSSNMVNSIATSAGPTVGQLDVSAMGGATYTVPISLPAGVAGMAPQVALVYNSQGGNGVVGLGWSISGLSAITRVPSSPYHDNKIGGVNFGPNDRFALDGQRLLLKSGTYGADGAEYQTENYTNIKIVSRGSSPFGSGHGPAYFEVFYPDGSKAVYGETNASRTSTSFALSYLENALGARINYTYSVSDHTFIVTEIAYGNLGTSQILNKVNFYYSEINRAEMGYTGGDRLYRKSLLNKITVSSSGSPYRSYVLGLENIPTLNYKRVTSITEYNGDESLFRSPLYFSYNSTNNSITTSEIGGLNWTGIQATNSEVITADYTGDGKMDFILKRNYAGSNLTFFYDLEKGVDNPYNFGLDVNFGYYKDVFVGNILSHNNKMLSQQATVLVKNGPSNNSYKFDHYVYTPSSPVLFQYDKTWDNVPIGPSYYSDCDQQSHSGSPLQRKFLSGDFNGDGLMDLISINHPEVITNQRWEWVVDPNDDRLSEYQCFSDYGEVASTAHFINLDRRITSNFVTDLGALTHKLYPGEGLYAHDFNGDGKTDFLHLRNGELYVYGVNESNTGLELLWQAPSGYINNSQQALFGDYNGDGKMDILFTTGYNNSFAMFLSTGRGFDIKVQNYSFSNVQPNWNGTYLTQGYLIPTDINNDGKTDIIEVYNYTRNNTGGWSTVSIHHNMGTSPAYEQHFAFGGSTYLYSGAHYPIPIFLNADKQNPKMEFGLLSMNSIKLARFEKDFKAEAQLESINQAGVMHYIAYKSLGTPDNYTIDALPYQYGSEQTYPNVDLQNLAGLNVVDKVVRTFNGQQLQQTFSYANAVSNVQGLGFLGFGRLTRSNWHQPTGDSQLLYTITLSNPQLRGAPIKSFVSKSSWSGSQAMNTNAADPHLQLSAPIGSAQTKEASKSITLLPGFTANGANGVFVAKITDPAAGVNDGGSLSDYINRTDYSYQTQTLPNKVFVNVSIAIATKDLLNGTNTLQSNDYDAYYNVTKSTTNFSGAGTKVEEITYDNNPGGYYIGRPLTKKTSSTSAGDTYSTEEQFTYTGFLPTQIRKKGHNTAWITETLQYDAFGNVTSKSIANNTGTRHTSSSYDITGRFALSSTDVEGMVSTATYDALKGTMLSSTNPYAQTTYHQYDTWGRPTESTDYLGKKAYTTYESDGNGGVILTATDDEGGETKTYANALGQTTQTISKTVLGGMIGKAIEYDVYGRAYRESQPAAPNNYTQWNESAYDEYGRLNRSTSYTGKVTNISYSGLSTTVNDGNKAVTTAKNALGQVTSVQDPGGTINYSYFANGNLKSADFGGSVQTIQYDGWGRKIKLIDPSAGQYTYAYNEFGELTQEVTPKGTTNRSYGPTGNLTGKSVTGDHTSLAYTYQYNTASKLLECVTFTNADGNDATYSYTYDGQYRPATTVENNAHAKFEKSFTYDAFGRVATETTKATNKRTAQNVSRTVAFTYQNGELLQSVDQATGLIISKVSSLNNKGLLASEQQGTNLHTSHSYDNFNLPQSSVLTKSGSPSPLMALGYNFDAQRGNLTSRSNSAFNWNENFSYDQLDRLKTISNNVGNQSQDYDNRGRITYNSELGNYGYSGAGYQQTELTNPTTTATTWYQSHSKQQISYNALKQPVNITELGHAQVDFQYNSSGERSHMYYGSNDADKMARPLRRHYSEDGSMEITEDLVGNATGFVFFLDGDAYSAPAIYKEIQTVGSSQQTVGSLYYLHRDHLGSIVMITNQTGYVVEKRQFDAWGNILALTDGAGNTLAAFGVLDRGYTGHEHLLSVGLIHMNGRLYDPKLHRFLSPDNFVQDPYNSQNFNRYGYVMNGPLTRVDKNGEFIHIIIGAVVGGVINLGVKAFQGKIKNWGDGFAAFGIGAVAGGLGAATGGASLAATGLAGASVAGGALAGAAGSIVASPIQGIGNSLYFGDSYSLKSFGRDVLFGAVGGAVVGGATALIKGNNIWLGKPIANGRNAFSFNNTNINKSSTSYYVKGNIEAGQLERVITTDDVSEALKNYDIQARVGNPIYKETVDEYLSQMNNGTFDLRHGAGGYTKGNIFMIDDGHHRIVAATIRGMQTGDYTYLQQMIRNGNFRPWNPGNSLKFGKFPSKWKQ